MSASQAERRRFESGHPLYSQAIEFGQSRIGPEPNWAKSDSGQRNLPDSATRLDQLQNLGAGGRHPALAIQSGNDEARGLGQISLLSSKARPNLIGPNRNKKSFARIGRGCGQRRGTRWSSKNDSHLNGIYTGMTHAKSA
jgi:hypothetical protein